MLQLPESAYHQLRSHGEAAYPHESCGVLIGLLAASVKSVMHVIPVQNASPTDTRSRYKISPSELIRIEKTARAAGLEILGFYHSHPGHPALWSTTDLAEAHWLGCSYVITEIRAGRAAETRSFHLAGETEDDKRFEAEEMRLAATPASQLNSSGIA